jgi:hypothetical protein
MTNISLLHAVYFTSFTDPDLKMREHLCFRHCKFISNCTMQLQCLQRAPGRRVTEKSQLFYSNHRSGRGSHPGHLCGTQWLEQLRYRLRQLVQLLYAAKKHLFNIFLNVYIQLSRRPSLTFSSVSGPPFGLCSCANGHMTT